MNTDTKREAAIERARRHQVEIARADEHARSVREQHAPQRDKAIIEAARLGATQPELAAAIEVSQQAISKIVGPRPGQRGRIPRAAKS